jgi:hypothetical protein
MVQQTVIEVWKNTKTGELFSVLLEDQTVIRAVPFLDAPLTKGILSNLRKGLAEEIMRNREDFICVVA